jgi:hypothetical protein
VTREEFIQEARRDFIEAGPEGHYPCPASSDTGQAGDQQCVLSRALETTWRLDQARGSYWSELDLSDSWAEAIGEVPTQTNERGYAACVHAYDQTLLYLTHQAHQTNPQEVTA